jgi:molybdate transport system substrate-binding protein
MKPSLGKMILITLIFLSLSLWGKTIYIGSAGNTSYVLPQLIALFQKQHPQIKIKPIIASSGKLTAQIRHHAPFQLFLSANMKYPQALYREGFGAEPPKIYARGKLSLVTLKQDLNLSLQNLPNLSSIAIANPKTAPYGTEAVKAFKNAGVYQKIKNKLVYSENVTGVIPYVLHGVEVGVVAESALHSPKLRKFHLHSAPVPSKYYTPIPQGALLLKTATPEARAFYNFLFTPPAQKLFKEYGYLVGEGGGKNK